MYFYSALRVRELAIAAARQRCIEIGVQFLDQSVSASGARFASGHSGLRVWRRYRFEFTSTGEQRYGGTVIMLGNKVHRIEMEPHRLPGPDPTDGY